MKIAHIITRLVIGGAQENTIFTVEGLLKKGYEVHLISGPTEGPEGSLEQTVRMKNIPLFLVPNLVRELNPVADARALLALVGILKQEKYNIVHTHSAKAGILGRIASRIARPRSLVIHSIHGPSFYPYQPLVHNIFYTCAERLAGYCTDHFICVGEIMKETYLKAGIRTPHRYSVIYSGFELAPYRQAEQSRLEMRKRLGIREDEQVIGMIGRLFHLKGQDYLLRSFAEAAKKFPACKLLLVGDGILRKNLEDYSREKGVADRVIFAGLVPPAEIPRYVSAMDILCHTSLREGVPKAVAQGLAGGKPAVAFDVDGSRELVHNGKTGFLIPAKDTDRLTEKLLYLLRNREIAAKMGTAGRRLVEELFPVEKMVAEIERLYLRLARAV